MRLRTVLSAAVAALGVVVAAPGVASANLLWCSSDPPVQTNTPSGTNLTVNTRFYASATDRHDLSSVTEQTVSAPDGAGGTLVTVYVLVPSTIDNLVVVAQVQRYGESATGSGTAGSTITLTMDVPTP